MNYLFPTVIISLYYVVKLGYSNSDGPTIKTDRGLIKGIKQFPSGIEINAYLGIPYALPPIGPRRYERTFGLRDSFNGVYQADKFGPVCYQNLSQAAQSVPGFAMDEKCLSLNIWTPKDAPGKTLYPVVVEFHGSDYVLGSSSQVDMRSDYLTAHTGVISANMNYRLGALGFAFDGTGQFDGNQAVHDILIATDWLFSNIRAFGGDPDQMTLSGLSAGAIMFSAIFMSPTIPTNWFKRSWSFSGVAVEHVTISSTNEMLQLTKNVSNELDCGQYSNSNDSFSIDEIVCLKVAPAIAIANVPANTKFQAIYGDKYILPIRPSDILNSRSFPNGHTMVLGTEANEGYLGKEIIYEAQSVTQAIHLLSGFLKELRLTSSADDGLDIARRYFGGVGETDIPQIRKRIVAFLSNLEFQCPSLLHSVIYSKGKANTVYMYRNNYITEYAASQGRPFGTYHGDDHDLFFGLPFRYPKLFTDKDRETSMFMMNVLGDYIKGKDPFWSPVNVTGHQPGQISLPRWNIKNNATITNVDYDEDKDVCLIWAKLFQLNI